jgi:hypothetical protein
VNSSGVAAMKHCLLSMSLLMLSAMWSGACEQSASRIPSATLTGPSTDEAAKTDQPIRILSGQLVYDRSSSGAPWIDVKGTKSFRLSSTFEGPIGPVANCPCAPGDRVRLDSMAIGLDVRGTVTQHGKTYDRIGGSGQDDPGLLLEFKGEGFIAPPFTDAATAEMSAPFTFSGTFSYYPDGPFRPSVVETLTGSGVATVRLSKLGFGPELAVWEVATAVFDFTK